MAGHLCILHLTVVAWKLHRLSYSEVPILRRLIRSKAFLHTLKQFTPAFPDEACTIASRQVQIVPPTYSGFTWQFLCLSLGNVYCVRLLPTIVSICKVLQTPQDMSSVRVPSSFTNHPQCTGQPNPTASGGTSRPYHSCFAPDRQGRPCGSEG